jgi:late competence protein required for DNA uptake (superfamily II DNA/RNA helicase)
MTGTCARCGGTATEKLILQSQYKVTTIFLCRDCFQLSRDLWEQFINFKPEQVQACEINAPNAAATQQTQ